MRVLCFTYVNVSDYLRGKRGCSPSSSLTPGLPIALRSSSRFDFLTIISVLLCTQSGSRSDYKMRNARLQRAAAALAKMRWSEAAGDKKSEIDDDSKNLM